MPDAKLNIPAAGHFGVSFHALAQLGVLGCALCLCSCATEPGHQPGADLGVPITTRDPHLLASLVTSTSTPQTSREQADALLVQAKGPHDETRLAVLEQLLFSPIQSDAMRLYAMDQLADADPARAARAVGRYLLSFDGPSLQHACSLAVTLADPHLIAPLVRSLDRLDSQSTCPAERPEWAALEKLSSKPADEMLWDLLAQSQETDTRIAALDILEERHTREELLSRFGEIPPRDAWLRDMQGWAASFGALPTGANEAAWVQMLHKPENAPLIARALAHQQILLRQNADSIGDYVAMPQFVSTLAYADSVSLMLTRPALLDALKRQLGRLGHVNREPSSPGAPDGIDQSLDANAAKLTRGDLLNLQLLLSGFSNPATIAELFHQGIADRADTSTEHGGLLGLRNFDQPILSATLFPPFSIGNDYEYVTGDKLLELAPTGLALYHFHFQQIQNADRAGPGMGDLHFARANRCNCVVITSVGPREMNIDYYTPAGAIVDLGVYHAPN